MVRGRIRGGSRTPCRKMARHGSRVRMQAEVASPPAPVRMAGRMSGSARRSSARAAASVQTLASTALSGIRRRPGGDAA